MKNSNFTFWNYKIQKWGKVWFIGIILLVVVSLSVIYAQSAASNETQAESSSFSISKLFTFLFLTLGPLKIIAPFAEMTRGQGKAFKRKLAFQGLLIAALGMLAAATIGSSILASWGVSIEALLLAAGIVLFLIALDPILAQYKPRKTESEISHSTDKSATTSSLAFSPLAFPTIVTPYGIAVLILLATLRMEYVVEIVAVTAGILVLNLLAMLFADFILKSPVVVIILSILGAVVGILQVALGVQVVVDALFTMGVV